MNWASLTKKQQLMVAVTIVLAFAQIFLLVRNLSSTRSSSAKSELLSLHQKLDEAHSVLLRRKTTDNELSQSIKELKERVIYTPTLSDRYAWAYEYVSRCATQARIELDSLEEVLFPDGKTNEASIQPYEINAAARCGYNRLAEFIWRLEKGNPLLLIKEIRISAVQDDPQSQEVRIVMQWPAAVKIEGNPE